MAIYVGPGVVTLNAAGEVHAPTGGFHCASIIVGTSASDAKDVTLKFNGATTGAPIAVGAVVNFAPPRHFSSIEMDASTDSKVSLVLAL